MYDGNPKIFSVMVMAMSIYKTPYVLVDLSGREPNFYKKYMVFWAKHLQMGPDKDILGIQ